MPYCTPNISALLFTPKHIVEQCFPELKMKIEWALSHSKVPSCLLPAIPHPWLSLHHLIDAWLPLSTPHPPSSTPLSSSPGGEFHLIFRPCWLWLNELCLNPWMIWSLDQVVTWPTVTSLTTPVCGPIISHFFISVTNMCGCGCGCVLCVRHLVYTNVCARRRQRQAITVTWRRRGSHGALGNALGRCKRLRKAGDAVISPQLNSKNNRPSGCRLAESTINSQTQKSPAQIRCDQAQPHLGSTLLPPHNLVKSNIFPSTGSVVDNTCLYNGTLQSGPCGTGVVVWFGCLAPSWKVLGSNPTVWILPCSIHTWARCRASTCFLTAYDISKHC